MNETSQSSPVPGPKKATLTIQRDKGWADKIRKYKIFLDGTELGQIGEGEVLRQQITHGRHVIEAKIDWCGSHPLEFDAQSGDKTVLVRSALRGPSAFLGLFYIIFKRQEYLTLELTQ